MKRLIFCIAVLATILLTSAWSLFSLKKSTDKLCSLAQQTENAMNEKSPDTEEKLNQLLDYWDSYRKKTAYFVKSTELDDISKTTAKLSALLKNNPDEFLSELRGVCDGAKKIYEKQYPYLYSIF